MPASDTGALSHLGAGAGSGKSRIDENALVNPTELRAPVEQSLEHVDNKTVSKEV
ncbi:hypothetical protein BDZ89DRAFT_1078895, partial [Hymenopellis radicata]